MLLDKKEKVVSKNLEDLTKLMEEFEEENARKSRKMLMGVEKSTNAAIELQSCLNKKEEELKIAKVKECNFIVQLDAAENELKSLQIQKYQGPNIRNQRGSFPNHSFTCYFCAKRGHTKAQCFSFKRFRTSQMRSRMYPPKIKQIWVRKDLVGQVREVEIDTKYRPLTPIWVVKNSLLPNLVKAPLVDHISF